MWHFRHQNLEPFPFSGLTIRDFTASGGPASASFAEIEVPPAARHMKARSTRSDKYYFCLEGAVRFQVAEEELVLRANDLLVIERGTWFAYANERAGAARLLLVHVPPFDLEAEEFRNAAP